MFQPFGPEKVAPVKEGLPTGQDDQAMYDLSLRLLQTLSSWTAAIMELVSLLSSLS